MGSRNAPRIISLSVLRVQERLIRHGIVDNWEVMRIRRRRAIIVNRRSDDDVIDIEVRVMRWRDGEATVPIRNAGRQSYAQNAIFLIDKATGS